MLQLQCVDINSLIQKVEVIAVILISVHTKPGDKPIEMVSDSVLLCPILALNSFVLNPVH